MRNFFFVSFFVSSFLFGDEQKKTVCLNMIVKNESEVIEKCLNSVKGLIDYWVIVDTGSNDGTPERIIACMEGIPGELHEREWIDFSHNRNEALGLAKNKGDYVLLIDADEVLQFTSQFTLPHLEKDIYYMVVRQLQAADIKRAALINNHIHWNWVGVLHEVIQSAEASTWGFLEGVINICNSGQGARAKDPLTRIKDGEILAKALEKEPTNSRYAYYAGISYLAAEVYPLAQKYFEMRLQMPSTDTQETYNALYYLAVTHEKMGDTEKAIDLFLQTHTFRPYRAEPLLKAAILYRKSGKILLGYLLSKYALTFPYPAEDSCVEYFAYDYTILVEFANCALLLGKYEEGLEACRTLLKNPNLPPEIIPQVVGNQKLAESQLVTP